MARLLLALVVAPALAGTAATVEADLEPPAEALELDDACAGAEDGGRCAGSFLQLHGARSAHGGAASTLELRSNLTEAAQTSCACRQLETNVDYPGDDLQLGGMAGRVPGHLSAGDCLRACIQNKDCYAYTFVKSEPWYRDNCALKSQLTVSRRRQSSCCDSQLVREGSLICGPGHCSRYCGCA